MKGLTLSKETFVSLGLQEEPEIEEEEESHPLTHAGTKRRTLHC